MEEQKSFELVEKLNGKLINFILSLVQATVPTNEQFQATRKLILDRNGEQLKTLKQHFRNNEYER